jgi:cobalamin biosynthetic protein CobC
MAKTAMESGSHGGDLDAARRAYPTAPEPWIDLSTGINPCPYPLPDLPPEIWQRLPQRAAEEELLAAATLAYGAADPAMVVAAPGTQALIQLLPLFRPASRIAILGPTYSEHAICWRRAGHCVEVVTNLATATAADVVVVVNPNNPTGHVMCRTELTQLAGRLEPRGGLLVVDEAFGDVLEHGQSLVPVLPPTALVLRSFGKTYGLAGLRLGFAIAPIPLAVRIKAMLGPWAVSGPAISIGRRALLDSAWLSATRVRLAADATRLDALLAGCGLTIIGGTPLFRLAEHPAALRVGEALHRQGIHVRRFADHATWLRFGLPGSASAWSRLTTSLRSITSARPRGAVATSR